MSRYNYAQEPTQSQINIWQANARRALRGARGRKALADLKAALLRLQNKQLISNQVYDGENVCAIGAYAAYKSIEKGIDPWESFEILPRTSSIEDTADLGQEYGLTYTLAWELAYRNDETWGNLNPSQRYTSFLDWINQELAIAS